MVCEGSAYHSQISNFSQCDQCLVKSVHERLRGSLQVSQGPSLCFEKLQIQHFDSVDLMLETACCKKNSFTKLATLILELWRHFSKQGFQGAEINTFVRHQQVHDLKWAEVCLASKQMMKLWAWSRWVCLGSAQVAFDCA